MYLTVKDICFTILPSTTSISVLSNVCISPFSPADLLHCLTLGYTPHIYTGPSTYLLPVPPTYLFPLTRTTYLNTHQLPPRACLRAAALLRGHISATARGWQLTICHALAAACALLPLDLQRTAPLARYAGLRL